MGVMRIFNWSIWLYTYVSIYLKIQEITTAKKSDVQAESLNSARELSSSSGAEIESLVSSFEVPPQYEGMSFPGWVELLHNHPGPM